MKPSEGYEQMDALAGGMVTFVVGNGEAEVTGSSGHSMLGTEPVTDCSGCLSCDMQGADQDASDLVGSAYSNSDEFADEVNTPTLPLRNPSNRPCHYYIDIPDGDDSTY